MTHNPYHSVNLSYRYTNEQFNIERHTTQRVNCMTETLIISNHYSNEHIESLQFLVGIPKIVFLTNFYFTRLTVQLYTILSTMSTF